MTIKKCSNCNKEDDFTENPLCDDCATELYCKLYRNRILELIDYDKELTKKIKEVKI